MFNLFGEELKNQNIDEKHIIKINLEDRRNKELRNPDALLAYIDSRLVDKKMHYILLDEVQLVSEYYSVNQEKTEHDAFLEYITYGGLPKIATEKNIEIKQEYLKNLFVNTYLIDIKERYKIYKDGDLDELLSVLASCVGSLTNPRKLADTFKSEKKSSITQDTIKLYLEYMQDAFLIEKTLRFDVKGKKYIDTPAKYYFNDLGLRNAKLNFRQTEQTHLMENLIYNELRYRGFSVDVGEVVLNTKNPEGKSCRKTLEVDFVCNKGFERLYIQSALSLENLEKKEQEFRSLLQIKDGFSKIVITNGSQPTYKTEDGILVLNLFDFLLEKVKLF